MTGAGPRRYLALGKGGQPLQHTQPPTIEELQQVVAWFDSHRAAAAALGVHEATLSRYLRGLRRIPAVLAPALRGVRLGKRGKTA